MTDERVPAIVAPETELRRGRVRVVCGDHVDVRTVTVADGRDAWAGWARETGFALQNVTFVDIGEAVYRSASIDRIEPIDADNADPIDEALQAALAVLTLIRDGLAEPRQIAAELLTSFENKGLTLRDS